MKKFTALLLILAVIMSLAACGGSSDKEKNAREDNPSITIDLETLKQYADETSGQFELMQKLVPDYVVYKNAFGMYFYHKVDKSLPLDDFDWSNLKNAHKGIDVSRYQKDIDWEKVAASGIEYAMIQCGYRGYTEGKLVTDKYYETNIQGALRAGLPVGVYFVTQAITIEEAIEEADYVLQLVKPYTLTYPIALDVEEVGGLDGRANKLSKAQRTEIITAFCERIKDAGYTPMIYSGLRWFMDEMDITKLGDYDKWFAIYGFNYPYLRYKFQIWQQSDQGVVDGIKGYVDINYSCYDYTESGEAEE